MDKITLAAVGDIMLGDHPVCFGHGIRSVLRKRGHRHLVEAVTEKLEGHDIVFGNLECVLSEIGHDEQRLSSSELRADKNAISLLQDCHVNVLSMANNHMLQHGTDAFADTADWLKQHGIAPVGLFSEQGSNVVQFTKGEAKVAIIGHSLRPEYFCKNNRYYAHGPNDAIVRQVEAIKQLLPDHSIVVSLHWGEEYLHTPSKEQVELAHRLIDSGATLILGHHPHVLQGIEEYAGGLIAYSLGNFIFDSWQKPTRESAILHCSFDKNGLCAFDITSAFISSDYSISAKPGKKNSEIRKKISAYTLEVSKRNGLSDAPPELYAKFAANAYLKYRIQCYLYFLTHIWKYKPKIIFSSLFRAFLRRIGMA